MYYYLINTVESLAYQLENAKRRLQELDYIDQGWCYSGTNQRPKIEEQIEDLQLKLNIISELETRS